MKWMRIAFIRLCSHHDHETHLLPGTPRHGDFEGMILRYELSNSQGGSGKNTTVSIKEMKLPGQLFEVPADYQELKKE